MIRHCLFLIDVEPDLRKNFQDSGWGGNELALDHLTTLRHRLEQRSGRPVNFNWFFRLDPQIQTVWGRADQVTQSLPDLLDQVEVWGDHRGLHCHLWRWDDTHQRWFNDFTDKAWEAHCVRSSFANFERAFGSPPTTFRMGERWMSDTLPPLLRELGIRYDLSIESGIPGGPVFDDPYATALLPDFTSCPTDPWDAEGNPGLTMIPTTASSPHWIRIYRFPYLQRQRVSLNLVLHPSIVIQSLQAEIRRDTRSPLVIVLRAADLAQPWALANFLRVAELLPSLPNCQWDSVEAAMRHFYQ